MERSLYKTIDVRSMIEERLLSETGDSIRKVSGELNFLLLRSRTSSTLIHELWGTLKREWALSYYSFSHFHSGGSF